MYNLASSTWNEEEIATSIKVLQSGKLTMGQEVREFEEIFAQYIGTKYAVMFNSGSSANLAMFTALKYVSNSRMQDGDHIIVPAVSWGTTYYPINQTGYVLDFVDVDLKTLNIDGRLVEEKITSKTRAITAVNLLGNPSDLIFLEYLARKYNLYLIEDNCESLGASINGRMAGSFGDMSSHSFFYSHHICTMEGGMVNTNSKALMETLISIRAHGWTRGLDPDNSVHPLSNNQWEDLYRFVLPGYNLRPTELSGAIGKVQIRKFPQFLENRRGNAELFVKLIKLLPNYLIQAENGSSSWFGFSIILQGKLSGLRNNLVKHLEANGVVTRPIVAGNFTLNPVMKHLKCNPLPNLVNSNIVHSNGLFIGNHHFDVTAEIERVYSLLLNFEKEYAGG